MKKQFFTALLFCTLFTSLFASTDICDISVGPDNKAASFANGEQVTVTMGYSTDEAGGVRIYARPYTNGNLTPGYGANPSGLYTGSGTATGWFTIISGTAIVDEISIEVFAADNVTLLRRFWIPVRFQFGNFGVNSFTYSSEPQLSSFLLGEQFTTNFQYNVSYPGGVRIFLRPFTNGALTPGYGASGSGIYTGAGNASSNFSINSGKNVHVDAIRVKIVSADQSVDIAEFFLPVNLYFSTVKINNIVAQVGNFPYNNDNREMNFSYSTTESGGVRIFPRPWTNGALTPSYAASGSPVYMGSGNASSTFTITTSNQRVDHVRFNVVNADQSETLLEFWSPVEYTFGNFLVEDIQLCPASPVRLENGAHVNINYFIYNDEGQDTRIFVRPMTNGSLTPGYAASGSPIYPAGNAAANDFFTINSGDVVVDQLRFLVTNADQSTTLAEYFIPVHYVFGNPTVPVSTPEQVVEQMSVFPNPASGLAQVSIALNESGVARLYLTDLSGRVVADLGERSLLAQTPEIFNIEGGLLGAGTYFVVAEGAHFRQTQQLILMR